MSFDFLSDLCESKLIPHLKTLHEYDTEKLAELAYLHILTLRILLAEHEGGTRQFAQKYCKRTAQYGNFKHWHTDETDIYVMLYGLISDDFKNDRKDHHHRPHLPIDPLLLYRWFRYSADKKPDHDLTHRLFVKLDTWFKINNSSMRAIRRLVMDWDTITHQDRRLALTRLLQFMRTRAAKGELLPWLNKVGVMRDLEIDNVDNPETGEHKEDHKSVKESLWRSLALESASGGATSAASVATAIGGLGAGFDNDYSKSVYPPPKKEKPKVIRRVQEDDFEAYHGTTSPVNFDAFRLDLAGSASVPSWKETPALWAAERPEVASAYAGYKIGPQEAPSHARVIPVIVHMNNPMIVDLEADKEFHRSDKYFNHPNGRIWNIGYVKDYYLAKAKRLGHDGVVFKNGYDDWMVHGDIYAVFNEDQMRMKIGNKR